MQSRRRSLHRSPVGLALAALALTGIIGACAGTAHVASSDSARPVISFENSAAEPVRVYLVERSGMQYLLGNVYPMQRARLLVPPHLPLDDSRQMTLVAVPLAKHRPGNLRANELWTSTVETSLLELTTYRWTMTSSSLHAGRLPLESRQP